MENQKPAATLRIFRENLGESSLTELMKVNVNDFFANDIVRHRLSGTLPSGPDYRKVNFLQSTLFEITATGVDFSECDFKDSLIKNASFLNCRFDGGTFATCFFSSSTFINCTFYNLAAHNSEFHQCELQGCDLTNLLVKSSKFRRCLFESCKTSNRIAEMSIFDESTFSRTDIQLETISENFGLRNQDLEESKIRSARVRQAHHYLTHESLRLQLGREDLSPLEKLRVEFFLTGNLMDGSEYLDRSLDLASWINIYQNPGTFVELLDRFSEFLVHLYDSDKIPFHPLLLLHYVTSRLRESQVLRSDLLRVAQSLGGVHLILSRIVEEYLEVLGTLLEASDRRLVFLVEGPLDPDYFQERLERWLTESRVSIARLQPRNSPLELEIVADSITFLAPVLALFLATRTRLEILRQRPKVPSEVFEEEELSLAVPEGPDQQLMLARASHPRAENQAESLFLLDLGLSAPSRSSYRFQMKSILPGSLIFDLRLNVSTGLIGRMRTIIVDLLSPTAIEEK